MPEEERQQLMDLVHEAVESAINKRVVAILRWVVGVGCANCVAILAGLWMFWDAQHSAKVATVDRWTGTMEYIAEMHRLQLNEGYDPVDINMIREKYKP